MSNAEVWKRKLANATEYASKVGKREHFDREPNIGRLHECNVKTQICWQGSPGAQNYWNDAEFDKALGMVIRSRFRELAGEALALMQREYKAAFIAEKGELLAKLAAIEALEQEQS